MRLVLLALAATACSACSTDLDCSLNGVCTAAQVCACDAPWSGGACTTLAYAATTPASGRSLYDAGADHTNTWNGPIIVGPDGRFRIIVPLYRNGSLGAPTSVLRGTASVITGPYAWVEQADLPAGENPAAVTYVDDATGHLVYSVWIAGRIFVSSSPDGPWAQPPGATYPGGNPAPLWHAARKAFFMTNQATLQVWTTPKIGGVWTVYANISHASLPINSSTADAVQNYHVEDPFMWIDQRGNWHIINHAYSNTQFYQCCASDVSAHFFSADGLTWSYSPQPYTHTVAYDDGTSHCYTTLERPNLHFSPAGLLTHINLAADLVTGNEGCANRTDHAHDGKTPCDNCKWDDLAGTTIITLAS